jgi:hypothetical protein
VKKVYIIGVSHCWQQLPGSSIGSPSVEDPRSGLREITEAEFAGFNAFLRDMIQQNSIGTIVEEACGHPHLRMYELAAELDLHHKYCELPKVERERRGIRTKEDREKYWLGVLAGVQHFPVLMICGATHVSAFCQLLSDSQYEPLVVVKDYEQTLFSR